MMKKENVLQIPVKAVTRSFSVPNTQQLDPEKSDSEFSMKTQKQELASNDPSLINRVRNVTNG